MDGRISMINQLLINEADADLLVGKFLLSRGFDEHNLVNEGNKAFVMEKRLKVVVSSKGRFGLARPHPMYDVKFYERAGFVEKINERLEDGFFYSLVTPTELKLIQQWQMQDLLAL